ncbi:NADH:quinone oxidoreductase I, chain C [Aliarcobacter faecis]|uniref:NADH-quinone oxidoreductase subunit C n=1 Tax=Aliarcobacter faecis TaxID=1564138 RepID=UPI00047EEE75|nr:NADH-quinone oxidoreductase subunit C [Aliarcobacter faecis]QKF72334.1 NADH:quinone oxidoreductase I, chain C [Aliarcobacter faecis]
MREYSKKDDVQKKSYYNDRFFISPTQEISNVDSDVIFAKDLGVLENNLNIDKSYICHTHLVLEIKKSGIFTLLKELKKLEYDILVELSCVDYLAQKNSFEIFYELLSIKKKKRVRVKTTILKDENIESVSKLFKSANWSEREVYDMFGVKFLNHPNLKRLLMPDDWYDHPLKKSYPLQGDETASWYEVDKIFGKSARDIIGPEIRDSSSIDRYDTTRFARLGHEVPYGFEAKEEKTDIKYQEENQKLVKNLDPNKTKTLERRK